MWMTEVLQPACYCLPATACCRDRHGWAQQACLLLLACYCLPTCQLPAAACCFLLLLLPAGAAMDEFSKLQLVEGLFLFSIIWSAGCTGDGESRRKFNEFFR